MKSNKQHEIDMLHDPLLPRLIIFAIPLVLSGVLQLLFNAADIVVIGHYGSEHALSAVGATSSLINLMITLFIGVSVGASVLMGRMIGSQDLQGARDCLHTALAFSMLAGFVMIILGQIATEPLLRMMETPEEVLPLAARYMHIYFLGMPGMMIYNFGSAILRAVGDTRRPLYFISVSGLFNVVGNLFFVLVLKMDVAGVATATILGQYVAAFFIILSLRHSENYLQLDWLELRINPRKLLEMLRIGLPAGVQGAVFSISNVLVQSSVNSFGSIVMAGSTASSNIEGFIYIAMNAFYQACMAFTAQNYGAKKYRRIDKILINCFLLVTVIGLVLGLGTYLLGSDALGIYTSDPAKIEFGLQRLAIIATLQFTCGWMEVLCGSLRGVGYSISPMIITLLGACMLRIVWIGTVFQWHRDIQTLYLCYPVSWFVTAIMHSIFYLVIRQKKLKKLMREEREREEFFNEVAA
ncbi:MAG: MATE family efflux transporter [Eubacteriales bacterium]|nr:MATE family efflux transporter [Eubacteriales bacterium]